MNLSLVYCYTVVTIRRAKKQILIYTSILTTLCDLSDYFVYLSISFDSLSQCHHRNLSDVSNMLLSSSSFSGSLALQQCELWTLAIAPSDRCESHKAPGHVTQDHQLSPGYGGDRWQVTAVGVTHWQWRQSETLSSRPSGERACK